MFFLSANAFFSSAVVLLKTFSVGLQKALKSADGLQLASQSVLLEFLKLLGIT